jgi:O-antigen ligase/polysaccharide polymerase Wzy-like membrane protein
VTRGERSPELRQAAWVAGGPVPPVAVIGGALAILATAALSGVPAPAFAIGVFVAVTVVAAYRFTLSWHVLLGLQVLVILFIPIRRFTMGGGLPFELEPYRVVVAFLALGWLISLLVDPRIRLGRSGLEWPFAVFWTAVVGSLIFNAALVSSVGAEVPKRLSYWISFMVVFFLIVSVVRTRRQIDALVKTLVLGGAVVAMTAIFEANSGVNVFNSLPRVLPFLAEQESVWNIDSRGGRARVYASAQHPIELGAVFALVLPLSVYVAHTMRRRFWWFVSSLYVLAGLATLSRTTIMMFLVVTLVFLWLRPKEVKRLWPVLPPLLVVVHFALPGALGALKYSFFPAGGLIAEQSANPGWKGSGRLADVSPSFAEIAQSPLIGHGLGTRIVNGPTTNAAILDNQWLGLLLEVGALGTIAWIWLLLHSVRRLSRAAKEDDSDFGWLFCALGAAVLAFGIGMLTFDAFGFTQGTLVLFILLAIACSALRLHRTEAAAAPRPKRPDAI